MAKIIHNKNECIGCGACTAVCPSNWELGGDNKAYPKKTEISDDELKSNKEAAEVCPVNCITIE